MSDNIFASGEATPTPAAPATTAPVVTLPDEAIPLIGDGKKYASVEAALKALPHAQNHIATLETELKDLREKAAKAASIDEVLQAMDSAATRQQATPAVMDEQAIAPVLARLLAAQEDRRSQERNVNEFKEALRSKYGDKSAEIYESKAKEMGLGMEFLNSLVAKSADAGRELFGLGKKTGAAAPTTGGSVNTAAMAANANVPKPKSVMGGASTQDILSAFRAHRPQ